MAKDGKKLELYEILAAKRDKGKVPFGLESAPARQANMLDSELPSVRDQAVRRTYEAPPETPEPGIIIDDAVAPAAAEPLPRPPGETAVLPPQRWEAAAVPSRERERDRERNTQPVIRETAESVPMPEPRPEPRPRSPREVVFSLETALIFFSVVFALVVSSYYLGYKRGQEEKPAGPVIGDIEDSSPDRVNLLNLLPAARAAFRPQEQDFTLLLRAEPAAEAVQERLELELAEAVALGSQRAGFDIQGFIFRSESTPPQYFLTVGAGRSASDPELDKLRQIYNRLEGITLSRVPTPYLGCRIARIGDLGVSVY